MFGNCHHVWENHKQQIRFSWRDTCDRYVQAVAGIASAFPFPHMWFLLSLMNNESDNEGLDIKEEEEEECAVAGAPGDEV